MNEDTKNNSGEISPLDASGNALTEADGNVLADAADMADAADTTGTAGNFTPYVSADAADTAGDVTSGVSAGASADAAENALAKQAQKYPPLTVEAQAGHTLCSRLFNGFALFYPVILSALVLAAVYFPLQNIRELWAPEETVFAEVLKNMLNGDWIVLQFNGSVYYDAPPLYFWFLAGIYKLFSLPGLGFLQNILPYSIAGVMFIGAAVSSLLLLWATLFMARRVAGFDLRCSFAAGCVLVSFFLFSGAAHYNSLDMLFTALVIMAEAMMFLALRRQTSMWRMGLGFVFAALAFLVKGLPGLLVPVACAVIFAFWQARPWRLLRKDFLLGLAFSLLPVVLWVGSIWASGNYEIVVRLIKVHFLGPVLNGWQFDGAWWYYCVALPLMFLPWIFIVLFPNWLGFFNKGTFKAIAGAFRGAYQGLSYVGLALICAGAGFLFLSPKHPLDLLPLLPPLAIIAGRMVLSLSPLRNMLLQRLCAVVFILLALVFAVLPVYLSGNAPSALGWLGDLGLPVLEVEVSGVYIIAVALLAAGCLFLGALNSRRPEATLLVMLLLAVGLSYPLAVLSMPSLDKILSPRAAGTEIRRYVDEGYTAFSLNVHPDSFIYYSDGAGLTPLPDEDALERVENEHKKIILLTTEGEARKLQTKLAFSEVKKFRLLAERYVLLEVNLLEDKLQ